MGKVKWFFAILLGGGLIFWSGLYPKVSLADNTCSDNVKMPPFLAQGVDPNLLLLFDNSASMFDLAYVDPGNYCYDDTYEAGTTYAGYFTPTAWYSYDFTEGEFEQKTESELFTILNGAAGTSFWRYSTVIIKINSSLNPAQVTVFAGQGNFLNWASSSKLDIQKKILTGGKYDSGEDRLTMESRGCLGRRFVKKIQVTSGDDNTYYLTLAVRPPDDVEKAGDSTDDTTRIEIFDVTEDGFQVDRCNDVITNLNSDPPNLGQLYDATEDCMGYLNKDTQFRARMATFNHSLQNCWYLAKHDEWQPGQGSVQAAMNDCEKIYEETDPELLTPEDRAYVCYGHYSPSENERFGYVGRCWNNGTWTSEECVDRALKDYCGVLQIPEVVDPTDQMSVTGDVTEELWNAPAVLIDSGVIAQMALPLAVLKGFIEQPTAPSGLVQEYANDIRMGAMIFNDDGSKSECDQPDPYVLYGCADPNNRDGGKIISYIDQSETHTNELVSAINNIKATSWTPLAEAMYNAIGYYTQNESLRLHSEDFLMDDVHPDPCMAWCQENNVLVITEGASTADLNSSLQSFVANQNDGDSDTVDPSCDTLSGSTLLDDLTFYAKNGINIFPDEQYSGGNKRNITTHIVVAGSLRSTGTSDECSPDILLSNAAENGGTSLYSANNPSELEDKLREALNQIRAGTAAGSAASVISASRGGEGALYQAIFWPKVPLDNGGEVKWIGEVHALLTDTYGGMYEDTNGNRTLDDGDERVLMFYDEGDRSSKVCYGTLNSDGTCNGTVKNLNQVHYLWSAADWLSSITSTDILANRTSYISNQRTRYIFTWNDLNNDGAVDAGEMLDFVPRDDWVDAFSVSGNRGPVTLDFGVQSSDEVNTIVKWVRGLDQSGLRSRQIQYDFNLDGVPDILTWRLGDVIHSTPISVERPAEGFQYLYRDITYARFANHYRHRRHVVYFGGNDGMLHAVNGGFYNETSRKFCRTSDCTDEEDSPELGAELWAYVPYNLISDLKCLTNPDYEHKYMVDLRPRVFDVQLWDPNDDADGTHIGGWGTILVAGMRFGGTSLQPGSRDLNGDGSADYSSDNRQFASSYFIFDITDPETPPVLLGEMTHTVDTANMGYSTVVPTVIVMKEGASAVWYLVMGSGPTELEGRSTQPGKIAVFPLAKLVESTPHALRIPNASPANDAGGVFELDANSFVSDMITVDFELDVNYKSDAVYFGTISGTWGSWGGKMYRLVTRNVDADGVHQSTTPSEWANLLSPLYKPNPLPLIDLGQPVTGAATVGTDGSNFWVYFGTGRFYSTDDKTDAAQQSYYGIKEPIDCDDAFTWETVEKTGTHNGTPGSQGLLRVDQILVRESSDNATATLSCVDGSDSCLPVVNETEVRTFSNLVEYIAGYGCGTDGPTGTDGWYRDFQEPRERNLGQGTLLGGLLTFTSYQPFDDICLPEGLSYLYGVYYQTGTAWRERVFREGLDNDGNVIERLSLGRGMSTTPSLHVGRQEGATAFIQTSTGTIVEVPEENLPIKAGKTGRASWTDRVN